jgi:hypothetical protein
MLLIAGVVMVSTTMRVLGVVNSATRGWMSAQWLAEHRAS